MKVYTYCEARQKLAGGEIVRAGVIRAFTPRVVAAIHLAPSERK